ncbi:hypothetical protein MRX96_048194 [Rhipicephalus microplus]
MYLRLTHSKSPRVPPLDLVLEENLQFPTTSSEMKTVSRGHSRSRDRSRLRGHSKSRGRSRSWARARSWSSARSNTGSSSNCRPQKPALFWASKVRGNDGKPAEGSRSPSKQSGLLHYVNQLESLRKENALLCIGNAQVKEAMKKTASEIAEFKKFALRQASDPSPEPITMELPEASTSRSGASKSRAKECKQSNATDKTLAAMEDVLSAMQSSLKEKKQIGLSDPLKGLIAINQRIERLESVGKTTPFPAPGQSPDMRPPHCWCHITRCPKVAKRQISLIIDSRIAQF